jgi:hypothetical protein
MVKMSTFKIVYKGHAIPIKTSTDILWKQTNMGKNLLPCDSEVLLQGSARELKRFVYVQSACVSVACITDCNPPKRKCSECPLTGEWRC